MPNAIPEEQNTEESIDLVAASSRAYAIGNRFAAAQFWLTLIAAVGGPAMTYADPALKAWAGLLGAVTLLVDAIFLEPALKRKKELGAKIQEVFDTQLFRLPWNTLKVGAKPDRETIGEHARTYRAKHPMATWLRDWYPKEVGSLSLETARLVCQRSNLRWDSELRRWYAALLLILLVAMAIGGLIFGLAMRWDADRLVLGVVVPLLPAALSLWRLRTKHVEAAVESERCKQHVEQLWANALKDDVSNKRLTEEARQLQDEVFDRRKGAPRIPGWVYWPKRESFEHQMRDAGRAMVAEAQSRGR
ncbi:MAG: S-4TM family putative pore-forming effector [Gemmataceae bacterium]